MVRTSTLPTLWRLSILYVVPHDGHQVTMLYDYTHLRPCKLLVRSSREKHTSWPRRSISDGLLEEGDESDIPLMILGNCADGLRGAEHKPIPDTLSRPH